MIAILHAFSRRNAGDSLLVDLTLSYLARAGIPSSDCVVFALDADSFGDLPQVRQVPSEPWSRLSIRALSATAHLGMSTLAALSRGRIHWGDVAEIILDADGIVGVPGGYLRAGTRVNAAGSLLNHIPQLTLATQSSAPKVYLPQSVGPLAGSVGRVIRRLLGKIDRVYVRDDESLHDLIPSFEAVRHPDVAILHLAETLQDELPGRTPAKAVLVARELSHAGYQARLTTLANKVGNADWAVQAEAVGRKSDRLFYEQMGIHDAVPLKVMLTRSEPAVVVSVRLHGALQSLIAGWPAIHLSYERKGWGAYADLGLSQYVHDAFSFDPELVARQVAELQTDAGRYWSAIEARLPDLRLASQRLVRDLQDRLAAPRRRVVG